MMQSSKQQNSEKVSGWKVSDLLLYAIASDYLPDERTHLSKMPTALFDGQYKKECNNNSHKSLNHQVKNIFFYKFDLGIF